MGGQTCPLKSPSNWKQFSFARVHIDSWSVDRFEIGSVMHRKIWIGKCIRIQTNKHTAQYSTGSAYHAHTHCTQHLTPFKKIFHKQNYWWSFNRSEMVKIFVACVGVWEWCGRGWLCGHESVWHGGMVVIRTILRRNGWGMRMVWWKGEALCSNHSRSNSTMIVYTLMDHYLSRIKREKRARTRERERERNRIYKV